MKRIPCTLRALCLLALLAACGPTQVAISPPTAAPTATSTHAPSPALQPTEPPAPKPPATRVPTVQTPPAKTAPSPPAQLLVTMDAIEAEMEELRGLSSTTPITRTLMTRQDLAAYLENEFAQDYPPEEVEADVRVWAAFDFVPEDFDLQRALLDLYSSEVLGLYDDEEDTFYIVSNGEFDLEDQLTFAHEYVHGLQDQGFDLTTFVDEDRLNDDEILARMALVEGDASLAMSEYLLAHLSEFTIEDLTALTEGGSAGSEQALVTAPPILRETLFFPYFYGQEFVSILQQDGWQAVDAAFADPPRSTEQILHPEKYLSGDEPQLVSLPPLTDTLGLGWHLIEAETLGEFQMSLYLVQQVDQEMADRASQGWDGDQYAVYAKDRVSLLAFATAWDSQEDREEFVAAYRQYAEGKYDARPTRATASELWWETPDQTAVLTWEGNDALIILGPDPTIVGWVLAIARP